MQALSLNKRVPEDPEEVKSRDRQKPKAKKEKKKEKKKEPKEEKKGKKEEKKEKKEERKKPASKINKGAGKEAAEEKATIEEYMKKQNRPYNALNVHDNLRGTIKKAQVMRLMDELVEEKVLVMKEYGKQRVYLYNQALLPEMSQTQVTEMDKEIEQIKQQIENFKQANKELSGAVKQAGQVQSVEELKQKVGEMTSSNEAMREKVDFYFSEEQALVPEDVMERAREQKDKMEQKCKQMKRGCLDLVDMLAEGQEKSRKEMMKKLELENE